MCHIAYHNCIFFWEYIKFTCILQALEKADNAETSAVESSGKVKGALDAVTKILETLGELIYHYFFHSSATDSENICKCCLFKGTVCKMFVEV